MKTPKYIPVLLSLFLTTLTCFSQQTEINKQSRWKIGLTFSPDVYFNPLHISTGVYTGYNIGSEGFNYTHGATLQFIVSPKIEIETGLVASKKDYSEKFYCHNCDLATNQTELISQRFIEIPLFVRYNIIDKRLGLHIETGFTNSFLITDINKTEYKGVLVTNKFLISGQIGLGFNFDLNQKINLSMTPTYKHSLTNIWKSNDYKLNSIGFVVGLSYRIMKNN